VFSLGYIEVVILFFLARMVASDSEFGNSQKFENPFAKMHAGEEVLDAMG